MNMRREQLKNIESVLQKAKKFIHHFYNVLILKFSFQKDSDQEDTFWLNSIAYSYTENGSFKSSEIMDYLEREL